MGVIKGYFKDIYFLYKGCGYLRDNNFKILGFIKAGNLKYYGFFRDSLQFNPDVVEYWKNKK